MRQALTETPLAMLFAPASVGQSPTLEGLADTLQQSLSRSVATGWREVRAVELVVDEVAGEFAGEDPLKPYFRDELDASKRMLSQMARELSLLGSPVDLLEPSGDDVEETWAVERRG